MAGSSAKFVKVLKAELEDLLVDISLVEKTAIDRLGRMEITEYVFRENNTLFRLEAEAIGHIVKFIDETDVSLYKSADEAAAVIDNRVKDMVREDEKPQAVYNLFARKMQKVLSYIDSGDCP
jgi:hypothetical protein